MRTTQKQYSWQQITTIYLILFLIACGINLWGCSSELPMFTNPEYPSTNIRLGIDREANPDEKIDNDISIDHHSLSNRFASIAHASSGFKDVNVLGEKTKEGDCDFVVSMHLTKLQYHESITIGTVITPTLLMGGGIVLLSIGGKEGKGGLAATYLGAVAVIGSIVKFFINVGSDKTDFSHTIEGTLVFNTKEVKTGKIVTDTVNVSHSIVYSHEFDERIPGTYRLNFRKELVVTVRHISMNVGYVRSFCEEYVVSKLCEKALDKISKATITREIR